MAGRKKSSNKSKLPLLAGVLGVVLMVMTGCSNPFSKKEAPRIEFTGEPVMVASVRDSLQAYRGKVVILDIWATWCGPCRMEIPGFIELQKKYQDQGLEIIGLSVDPFTQTGEKAVAPFIKSNGINYQIWMVKDPGAMVGYETGGGNIPTTYVINRDGNIVQRYIGAKPLTVFENDIKKLL